MPEPYLSYLNEAADRWSRYIKYNSQVYQIIKNDLLSLEYVMKKINERVLKELNKDEKNEEGTVIGN